VFLRPVFTAGCAIHWIYPFYIPSRGSITGDVVKRASTRWYSLITIWVEQYERNNERVKSRFGRQMKSKRQSTVEPVWGTLTQFMGLRKINTIGIKQANKVMHLAATAYNLKKLLKFITTKVETAVGVMSPELALKTVFLWFFGPCLTPETEKTIKNPAF